MRSLLSLVLVLFAIGANAKSYNKSFIMNMHPEGKLYFVYATKMPPVAAKDVGSLKYDYTHIDSRDEVAFLLTCSTIKPAVIESVSIVLPSGVKHTLPVEKIYHNKNRKMWESRIRCYINRAIWFEMYSQEQPFQLELQLNDGTTLQFCDKPRKWQKNREKLTFIQEVITLNRN